MTPEMLIQMLKIARSLFLGESYLDQKSGQKYTENVKQACNYVKLYTREVDGKVYRIFGVLNEDQDKINYGNLRKIIAQELTRKTTPLFSQIIGDTKPYSLEGTIRCKKFLKDQLEHQIPNDIILYGLTGKKNSDGSRLAANTLVNDWLDNEPTAEKSARVIANVVDFHTVEAISNPEWKCAISQNVVNFYLVYSKLQPRVKFGDDTPSSDQLTNNKALCFDGGIQSLRQAFYMMKRGIRIDALTKLRESFDEKNSELKVSFLSAAEFISELKRGAKTNNPQEADREKIVEKYLAKHILYDSTAQDALTKDALWIAALNDLKEDSLWKRLPQLFNVNQDTILVSNKLEKLAISSGAKCQSGFVQLWSFNKKFGTPTNYDVHRVRANQSLSFCKFK